MRQVLVATVQESYDALYPQITAPVELVWGQDDTVAPVSVARAVLGDFGDAPLDDHRRRGSPAAHRVA